MPTKTEQDIIANVIDMAAEQVGGPILWVVENSRCESPIERIFIAALYASMRVLETVPAAFSATHFEWGASDPPRDQITIYSQAKIELFRVDFLVCVRFPEIGIEFFMAIECDGHDFHERTKDQAVRDRARDRRLQDLGFLVFRFTGSEIWRNPYKCAEDVCSAIRNKMLRSGG